MSGTKGNMLKCVDLNILQNLQSTVSKMTETPLFWTQEETVFLSFSIFGMEFLHLLKK